MSRLENCLQFVYFFFFQQELGHGGQSKIFSYMSPTKSISARTPLQEENSSTHNEGKYVGKASVDVHKKADGKYVT